MRKSETFGRASLGIAIVGLLCLGAPVLADSVIDVGTHQLLPNTPNQLVSIVITGTDQVAGIDFYAQLGDGGTYNGGTMFKPAFQNVDIITGTIFGANNNGAAGDPSVGNPAHPLIWIDGTLTASGTVPVQPGAQPALLATLKIDTTGVTEGAFPLLLSGVGKNVIGDPGASTTLYTGGTPTPINLTIINGQITVPEPATFGLLMLGAVAALTRRRR